MKFQGKKRIIPHVLIAIPCLLTGGTEMQTLSLVRILISGGYKVTVCCYYEHEETMCRLFQESGAEVILLGLDKSKGLFHLIRNLKAVFHKNRPDIVHVQYMAPGLAPIIAARLSRIRTVFATVHQPGRVYGLKAKLLLRFGALLCNAFFCVSQSAEKSWFGTGEIFDPENINRSRKHFTIYNTVDTGRFVIPSDSLQVHKLKNMLHTDGHPVIGMAARLREEKGQAHLLNAMPDIIKSIPDAVLLMVGDGPDRIKLQAIAENLGIAGHVIWAGNINHEQIPLFYAVMDVAAVPSMFEGFGLTAAEAMAAGLPVVASDVDGLREVVDHGKTGYLFPAGNSKSLAGYIKELISDTDKCMLMGKAGQKRAEQYFSMEGFAMSMLSAYNSLKS